MERNIRRFTKRNLKRKRLTLDFSMTNYLVFANVIFFFLGFVLILYNPANWRFLALQPSTILQGQYLWTFLTSMFMHANLFHLFVNMFVLFSLGSFCEKVIGSKRFFWFYILSGLFAGMIFVFLAGFFGNTSFGSAFFGDPSIPGVGASGAIFAIAGLFMILTPKLRFSIIFLPMFSLPAYIMIPLVLFATWLISAGTGFPVGNTAHFGGFLAGIFYGLYLKNKYSKKVKALNKLIK